jgi:hypothetical protein
MARASRQASKVLVHDWPCTVGQTGTDHTRVNGSLFVCALVNSLHRDSPRWGRVRIISVVAVFRRERVGAYAAGKLVNAERG